MITPRHLFVLIFVLVLGNAAHLAAVDVTTTQAVTDEEFVGPLLGWRNVKTAYGAVGDGVADDTLPLQNAINDLRTSRNNGYSVLYLPAGTYRTTAEVSDDFATLASDAASIEQRWRVVDGAFDELITARDLTPLGNASRRFLRLKAVHP